MSVCLCVLAITTPVFKCYDPASVKCQVIIVLILRKMKMLESFCFAIYMSIDIIDDVW